MINHHPITNIFHANTKSTKSIQPIKLINSFPTPHHHHVQLFLLRKKKDVFFLMGIWEDENMRRWENESDERKERKKMTLANEEEAECKQARLQHETHNYTSTTTTTMMNAICYSQGTHDKHDKHHKHHKHVSHQYNKHDKHDSHQYNKGIDPKARKGHGRLLLLVLVSVGRVLLMLSEIIRPPSRT